MKMSRFKVTVRLECIDLDATVESDAGSTLVATQNNVSDVGRHAIESGIAGLGMKLGDAAAELRKGNPRGK
jgi:hypothetical protein